VIVESPADRTPNPELVGGNEPSGHQFRVRDAIFGITVLSVAMACFGYSIRRGEPPSGAEFYVTWTLLMGCSVLLARASRRFGKCEDPRYAQAYQVTTAVDGLQRMTWILASAAVLASIVLQVVDVWSTMRFFVVPLVLFVPICLFSNLLSLTLVCELHDLRFLGYRLNSMAMTLLSAAWVVVESHR
jgi:hypothetical protein